MKIAVSGPAATGKTYFIGQLKMFDIVPESARIVNKHYPVLVQNNIEKFRKFVSHLHVYKEQQYVKNVACDRCVIDNLAFTLLGGKGYEEEKERILSLYESKKLTPYNLILYFDVIPVDDPLLRNALNDPLRKNTINIYNYAQHVLEFKDAFFYVAKELGVERQVTVLTAYTTAEHYTLRNQEALQTIQSQRIQQLQTFLDVDYCL
mgnify:CR=1 FL=1